MVATWTVDDAELFLVAPKTLPPLTTAKVVAWPGRDGHPLLLCNETEEQPLGYIELNPMPGEPAHLWVGHCLIRPDRRGAGLGRVMVSLALDQAFTFRSAERVSLVVFPYNRKAMTCYSAAGFLQEGEQTKYFSTTRKRHTMLQMSIDLRRYRALKRENEEAQQ